MSTKIYVGNLSFNTEDQDLETLFSQNGAVNSVHLIRDRETGRAKGFGFIEMENKIEANTAIEKLNESEFMGRNIRVNLAQDKVQDRPNRRRF